MSDLSRETGDSLAREIEQLERLLADIRQKQQSQRWMMRVSVGVMLVTVVAFGLSLYSSVRTNLSQEEIASAAQQRWAQLRPTLEWKLRAAAIAAMPSFREQASRRLREIGPELQQDLAQRMTDLPQRLQERIRTRVEGSLQRVAQQTGEQAKTVFPALAGMESVEIAEHMETELAIEGTLLNDHLKDLVDQEKQRVKTAISKLAPPLKRPLPDHHAERELIHQMLMVADYELLNYGTEEIYLPPLARHPTEPHGSASARD